MYRTLLDSGFKANDLVLDKLSWSRISELMYRKDPLGDLAFDGRPSYGDLGPIFHRSERGLDLRPLTDSDACLAQLEYSNMARGKTAVLLEWARRNWFLLPLLVDRLTSLCGKWDLRKWAAVIPLMVSIHNNMSPVSLIGKLPNLSRHHGEDFHGRCPQDEAGWRPRSRSRSRSVPRQTEGIGGFASWRSRRFDDHSRPAGGQRWDEEPRSGCQQSRGRVSRLDEYRARESGGGQGRRRVQFEDGPVGSRPTFSRF